MFGLFGCTADSLEALGELAASMESDVEATRLLAAASAQRDRIACVRWPPETEHWTALIDGLRDRLGQASFDDAWSDGQELGLEEAVTYARRGRGARKRPPRGRASLTPAELQIVELVTCPAFPEFSDPLARDSDLWPNAISVRGRVVDCARVTASDLRVAREDAAALLPAERRRRE